MQNLSLLSRRIKLFFNISNRDKVDFIKAFFYMGIFRAYILFVPFNKLRKRMGKLKIESPEDVDMAIYREAKRVASIISIIAKYTPWESKCLVQALTAQKLLSKLNIATTLYLGVKKDKDNNMLAHAWTRCGKYFVTGGYNKEGYAVVAKFTK